MASGRPRRPPALSDERRAEYGLKRPARHASKRASPEPVAPAWQEPEPPAPPPVIRRAEKQTGRGSGTATATRPPAAKRRAQQANPDAISSPVEGGTPSTFHEEARAASITHASRAKIWGDGPEEESHPPYIVRPPLLAVVILALAFIGGIGVYLSANALFGPRQASDRSETVLPPPTAVLTPAAVAAPAPATSEPSPPPEPDPPATLAPATPALAPAVPVPGGPAEVAYIDVEGALRVNSAGGEDVAITSGVQHPAWSPDGSQIAFVKQVDGQYEIWTWQAASGMYTKLLGPVGELIRSPAWQPDGKALLYHEQSGGNETGRIMRLSTEQGTAPEIVLDPSTLSLNHEGYDSIVHAFDVAPDGRIVFQASIARRGAVYADGCAILVTLPGGGASEVTSLRRGVCDGLPSVSPDGQRVAFISYPGDGAGYLAVANIDGTGYQRLQPVRLRGVSANPFWPRIAWSADSERLYYESVEGGDALFMQHANDPAGLTRQVWGYGRHPAIP